MGQGLTGEAAVLEATRLLSVAIMLLDDARESVAAAHVASALDFLSQNANSDSVSGDYALADHGAFAPTWGNLVDRHASVG